MSLLFLRVHFLEAPNIVSVVLSSFHTCFFGLRGLMSSSCGTFMLVRCVDWWSVSWHCLVCVCVSKVVNIAAFLFVF